VITANVNWVVMAYRDDAGSGDQAFDVLDREVGNADCFDLLNVDMRGCATTDAVGLPCQFPLA
jgi:hypothetical protein